MTSNIKHLSQSTAKGNVESLGNPGSPLDQQEIDIRSENDIDTSEQPLNVDAIGDMGSLPPSYWKSEELEVESADRSFGNDGIDTSEQLLNIDAIGDMGSLPPSHLNPEKLEVEPADRGGSENASYERFLLDVRSFVPKGTVLLSKDGKSITLSGVYDPIIFAEATNLTISGSGLLTLLYKIQASQTFMENNELRENNGIKIGFGLRKGVSRSVNIQQMIEIVHKANGTKFVSFDDFEKLAEKICNKHQNTVMTKRKRFIFTHFIDFYNAHSNDPNFMPRSVMVERWANFYIDTFRENPFDNHNLNFQRLFSIKKSIFQMRTTTDSIDLFNDFLVGESVPESLKNLMQEPPQRNALLSK